MAKSQRKEIKQRNRHKIAKEKYRPSSKIRNKKTAQVVTVLVALTFIIVAVLLLSDFIKPSNILITVVYPFDKSVFPPEIIAPQILWEDKTDGVETWEIQLKFKDGYELPSHKTNRTEWIPSKSVWEKVKEHSSDATAILMISGIKETAGLYKKVSHASISFRTSSDSVGAPIFYRDVPLPFRVALRNVPDIRWRMGRIDSYDPPPTVLTNLPVCGNCHSFSADGKTLGMDVDIGNDKGAYVLTKFEDETILSRDRLISWSQFVRDKKVPTFGMLPNVSPDGRFVLSGVKDRSVFLPRRDLLFSQIFFPVMGILAYYDRKTGKINALPGAADDAFVQANGVWTHDGQSVVFARNHAIHLQSVGNEFKDIILNREESIEVLGGEEFLERPQESPNKFLFSLYRVPFNNGSGGRPQPVEGASHNGMSNYFPKFSPDGKWMVFTQAHSFMLLQPDSKLYIMPASGGTPRQMKCNTDRMNSWHSWSPNSKWLVFSSKKFSPNTQLFLTHIDENGDDSPPVLLRNFTPEDEDRGANIPEFVNISPDSKRKIHERFLDDYNYFRSGRIYEQFQELDRAEEEFRKALAINPKDPLSRYSLASIYVEQDDYKKAQKEFEEVARLDPNNAIVHKDLGSLYFSLKEFEKAEKSFRKAVSIDPQNTAALNNLGSLFIMKGAHSQAKQAFTAALESELTESNKVPIYFNLGRLYIAQKNFEKAKDAFSRVLKIDSENSDAMHNLGNVYRILGENDLARAQYAEAARLNPDDASNQIELGQLAASLGDFNDAVSAFQKALTIDPENVYARIFMGRVYKQQKDFNTAARCFYEILESDPNNVFAYINLGQLYNETREFEKAAEALQNVLRIDPDDARACFLLGEILHEKLNKSAEAIKILKQGLKLEPKYFNGYIALGNCYQKQGNLIDAIQAFERALLLDAMAPGLKNKIQTLKNRVAQES